MVALKLQKRLAASVLDCGRRKVWLDPNEVNEISMANSSKPPQTLSSFKCLICQEIGRPVRPSYDRLLGLHPCCLCLLSCIMTILEDEALPKELFWDSPLDLEGTGAAFPVRALPLNSPVLAAGQNIRKLVKDGFVIRKPTVIHSRARARRSAEAKSKGRHTGYGTLGVSACIYSTSGCRSALGCQAYRLSHTLCAEYSVCGALSAAGS